MRRTKNESQALPFFLYIFLFCWKTYLEKLHFFYVAGYRKCINKIAPAMYWFCRRCTSAPNTWQLTTSILTQVVTAMNYFLYILQSNFSSLSSVKLISLRFWPKLIAFNSIQGKYWQQISGFPIRRKALPKSEALTKKFVQNQT